MKRCTVMKQYLIPEKNTLKSCLQQMNQYSLKYLIATNDTQKVVGTITDGDIRRALLHDISLACPISMVAHRNFSCAHEKDGLEKVLDLFNYDKIEFIPILNESEICTNLITRRSLNAFLLKNLEFKIDFDFISLDKQTFEHEISSRPWGFYKTVISNDSYQAKVIHVSPNSKLNLQSHKHREEHWIVVNGEGTVQIGESFLSVTPGSNFFIPKGCKHRLINESYNSVMVLVEVQLGDYFGEEDIVRYEDEYGRE